MAKYDTKLMGNMKLHHPVYTLNKQLLLPAGTEISKETLDYVILSNNSKTYRNYFLLEYIEDDLLKSLRLSPYEVIFADRNQITVILNLLEKVSVSIPILEIFDYFKTYDRYTYLHILRTLALTTLLSKDLISDYQDIIREVASCPAHDIGKICVPLHILKKSTPLTSSELDILRSHALAGYVLLCYYLRDTQNLSAIIARDHHERKDGSGYPIGKSLTNPMVEIVAVCDIYDALISNRPYRTDAFDNRAALEELTKMAERNEIGWDVVKVLVAYNRKDRPHFSDCVVSSEKRVDPPEGNFYGVIEDNNNENGHFDKIDE